MKTVWEYSLESEATRLIHSCQAIASGFFKLNNFIVLPLKQGRRYDENEVSFPDLPYTRIPRFWSRSQKIETKVAPLKIPEDLLNQTLELLNSNIQPRGLDILSNRPTDKNFFNVQKLWAKHQDKILAEIYKLIPGKKNCITGITIWPTTFGTNCSFSLLKGRGPIYIWLRQGSGITSIIEAILSSITRIDVYQELEGGWSESEIIVDWLLSYSSLGKMLQSIDPGKEEPFTIQKTRQKQEGALLKESEEFLKKIGVPATERIFSLKNGSILIRQKPAENLTAREEEILRLLVTKSPNVVTVDQIGDILFGEDEDAFSLFAIAKAVERLRTKLEANGVSGSFLQTQRGQGYLLKN